MIESIGTLDYGHAQDGTYRLVVNVDPAIVELYRALVPRWIRLNRQKHAPHMTVVREATLPNPARWGTDHGAEVVFHYRPEVQAGEVYYWLEAYCPALDKLRVELGLPPSAWYTKPPDLADCYHVTIGNKKR